MGLLELDYPGAGDRFPAQINDMLDRIAALERQLAQSAVLPGTIQATCGATADVGYALVAGQTLTNAQSTNPALWGRAPANWKSGANIILPDARGKFLVMDDSGAVFTLGVAGGSLSKTIAAGNLPAHSHTIDHGHSHNITTNTVSSDHTHNFTNALTGTENQAHVHGGGPYGLVQASAGSGLYMTDTGTILLYVNYGNSDGESAAHNHYVSGTTGGISANHTHQILGGVTSLSGGVSGNGPGSGTALDITPANLVINWQIKL